jgi:hypothetical protein
LQWVAAEYLKLNAALSNFNANRKNPDYVEDDWIKEIRYGDGIKVPPNPVRALAKRMKNNEADIGPEDFYLMNCSLHAIIPHVIDETVKVYCPRCHEPSGWKELAEPRRYIREKGWGYTTCYLYRCNTCVADGPGGKPGKSPLTFMLTNPEVWASLPEHITVNFPAFLTEQSGLDTDMVNRIPSHLAAGGTMSGLASALRESTVNAFHQYELAYERMCRDYLARWRENPPLDRPRLPNIRPWNRNFADPSGWGGFSPSRESG